jgi:PAS domain S-box-containing protein
MSRNDNLSSFIKSISTNGYRLSTQIVLSFIVLVILASITVGLPAIWIIQERLNLQAHAQLSQGYRAGSTLYASKEHEATDLAALIAHRPTLFELIQQGTAEFLSDYLNTLLAGSGAHSLIVCDADHQLLAMVGVPIPTQVCEEKIIQGYKTISSDIGDQVWLLAKHPVEEEGDVFAEVIIGISLNNEFATKMRDQTGLEHSVMIDGQTVATSFSGGVASREAATSLEKEASPEDDTSSASFVLDGNPYYYVLLPMGDEGIEIEISLAVGEISASQRRVIWTMVGSILGVATLGSLVGVALARRLGRPLAGLSDAAAAFSEGNLEIPVDVESHVQEVTMVAQALESARIDLQRTLNQLKLEKDWKDHLLDAIVEGIVTLDDQGRITFFSPGAERITGWRREQVLNQSCDEVLIPSETNQPLSELIPAPGQRRKITVELANGQQADLAMTGAKLAPTEVGDAEIVFVFRDVSEEEAVHRLLGHFMANISHEFRTPLSALAASIELLMDQPSQLGATEFQELLNSLYLGILGLQTLVDNLLESAGIETGHFRVTPRPSRVENIIGEATKMIQPLFDKRDQQLKIQLQEALPSVIADPKRTVQVVVNLLSNANKYSPDQSVISIDARSNEGFVRIHVADRGPGIPSEQKEGVFHRFSSFDPGADKAQYGAGLGLSVVKAVVEAQGGEVGVDDRPDGGSVFWFTLPTAEKS